LKTKNHDLIIKGRRGHRCLHGCTKGIGGV